MSADGGLAAASEATRIVFARVPSCETISELVVDPRTEHEVAWIGTPPRMLVLTRHPDHTVLHLVDPHGPRTLAELQLAPSLHLAASVGAHALLLGSQNALVLTADEAHLTTYAFPTRARPTVAGVAGKHFVVALEGAVEEWDPTGRIAKRRLRLPRPGTIAAVGGSERVVWVTTRQAPARIDVLPLIHRGQPRAHELPEPLAALSSHPTDDLLACIGVSGRAYAIDLDGRTRQRVLVFSDLDRVDAIAVVGGRMPGVLAAQRERPLSFLPFDHAVTDEPSPTPKPAAPAKDLAERFAAARDRREIALLEADPVSDDAPGPAEGFAMISRVGTSVEPRSAWRDECLAWARAVLAMHGVVTQTPPSSVMLDDIVTRFALSLDVTPALALLYGAHLAGHDGVGPVDIAHVLDRRWDEALGRGALASTGIARYEASRVRLATPIQRVLDELPPQTGSLVGAPGTLLLRGAHAVVDHGDALEIALRWVAHTGHAILVGRDSPADVCLEARARGAVALLPARQYQGDAATPAIYVADNDADLARLGLPRLDSSRP